jgi:hypothetical protein
VNFPRGAGVNHIANLQLLVDVGAGHAECFPFDARAIAFGELRVNAGASGAGLGTSLPIARPAPCR